MPGYGRYYLDINFNINHFNIDFLFIETKQLQ